jgi:NAD(P)-dependent dehydrogenase (short-subunit alcohol dehydrogenase family)
MNGPAILITGGRGGIAAAIATSAVAAGQRTLRVTRGTPPADEDPAQWISADVSTEDGARDAVLAATQRLGAPPMKLVHAAGNIRLGAPERLGAQAWREVLGANLDSAFFTLKAWIEALRSAGSPGAAVLFSSAAARVGTPNHAAVAAAKGGIEALARSLAADVSARGVRINVLAPGMTETPMTQAFMASERSRQNVVAQYPLGRAGRPGDLAAAALWLLGDEAGWITGQVLGVDGGFTAVRPLVRPAG